MNKQYLLLAVSCISVACAQTASPSLQGLVNKPPAVQSAIGFINAGKTDAPVTRAARDFDGPVGGESTQAASQQAQSTSRTKAEKSPKDAKQAGAKNTNENQSSDGAVARPGKGKPRRLTEQERAELSRKRGVPCDGQGNCMD